MRAEPDFLRADPPSQTLNFISRIEDADPNDPDLDEDNSGLSWGHRQFTAGSMTCSTVIMTWSDIGNTDTACKLISEAIRTSRVARFFWSKGNPGPPTTSTFLSDTYVDVVVNRLWKIWVDAHVVSTVLQALVILCSSQYQNASLAPHEAQTNRPPVSSGLSSNENTKKILDVSLTD